MHIVAGLTDEQRQHYADKADRLATCAAELAAALRTREDVDALVCLALVGVAGRFVIDLRPAFVDVPGDAGSLDAN